MSKRDNVVPLRRPSAADHKALAVAKLTTSGLDLDDAKKLGIEILSAAGTRAALASNKHVPDVASLKIQYHTIAGEPRKGIYACRLLGEIAARSFADVGKPKRYLRPAGCPPAAYFPRLVDWERVAADTKITIVVTEGEFKAACAARRGHACLSIPGVDAFSSTKRGWPLLPEMQDVQWRGRRVVIVFDSDVSRKPEVARAMIRLVHVLGQLGAVVSIVYLPDLPGVEKTGLDEFLVRPGGDVEFQALVDDATPDDLAVKLCDFNSRFAVLRDIGSVVDEQAYEGVSDAPDTVALMKLSEFRERYTTTKAQKVVSVDASGRPKVKEVKVVDEWIDWPSRREYACVTFRPGVVGPEGSAYNLWRGWAVDEEPGDVGPWTDLLDQLFADRRELRRWFEQWCAWPIAHPDAGKLHSACMLWGAAVGTGKTTVGLTLRRIYGPHAIGLGQADLENPFNFWALNRQFVTVDEMTNTGVRERSGFLKNLVTQERTTINRKNQPQFTVRDFLNYYLTSNYANAVQVDERDRRIFVHEVLTGPCGNAHATTEASAACAKCKSFWKPYYRWLDHDGGARHLLHHLRRLDFAGFEPKGWAPMTEAKQEMIDNTRSELAQWVATLRNFPETKLWGAGGAQLTRDIYTASELVSMFDRERRGLPVTPIHMGIALTEHGLPRASRSPLTVDGKRDNFRIVRNVQKWLAAGRAAMERHVAAELAKERPVSSARGRRF